jgi:hypothetical protein
VTAATAPQLTVRVTVADVWETAAYDVGAAESVEALKRRALAAARIDPSRGPSYEVKFGGRLVRGESVSLAELGVTNGAALVILSRRRRPVR